MAKFSLANYAANSQTARDAAQLLAPLVAISGTSLTASKLYTAFGNFDIADPLLTSISFPDLAHFLGTMTLDLPALTSLDLSALIDLGNLKTSTLTLLASLNVSSLVRIGRDFGSNTNMPSLTSLSFPALTTIGRNFEPTITVVTSISVPVLEYVGNDFDFYSEEIANLSIPSLKHLGGLFRLNSAGKLTQASVDAILVRLAALNGTGGTTSYDNQTIDLGGGTNASPSATGLAAKATLEGRGNTVTVN